MDSRLRGNDSFFDLLIQSPMKSFAETEFWAQFSCQSGIGSEGKCLISMIRY